MCISYIDNTIDLGRIYNRNTINATSQATIATNVDPSIKEVVTHHANLSRHTRKRVCLNMYMCIALDFPPSPTLTTLADELTLTILNRMCLTLMRRKNRILAWPYHCLYLLLLLTSGKSIEIFHAHARIVEAKRIASVERIRQREEGTHYGYLVLRKAFELDHMRMLESITRVI
jgi:hypothetical protein